MNRKDEACLLIMQSMQKDGGAGSSRSGAIIDAYNITKHPGTRSGYKRPKKNRRKR